VLGLARRRRGGSSKEAERGIEVQNIVQSTRKTFGVPSQGVLIAVVNLINHVFDFHVRDQEQWLCVFVLQQ
jgi:hypothetical protein